MNGSPERLNANIQEYVNRSSFRQGTSKLCWKALLGSTANSEPALDFSGGFELPTLQGLHTVA